MYREDIEPESWTELRDNEIWMRLAKIDQSGATLSTDANQRLIELSERHPDWRLSDEQREEIPGWAGGWHELNEIVPTPRRRRELVEWIQGI